MRLIIALFAGMLSLAAAQTTNTITVARVSSNSTTTTSHSPTQTCLAACKLGDVNCQASCHGNPHPNGTQVNATATCSRHCRQGNGTRSETEQYGQCLANCRASHFLSTGTNLKGAAATATGGASNSTTGASKTTGATSTTASGAAAATASRAAGVADIRVTFGAPVAGAIGLLLAAIAL